MKRDVIFIHGFGSGVGSSKWKHISSAVPFVEPHIFESDYSTDDPLKIIKDLEVAVKQLNDPILIGHSLGALFARIVSSKNKLQSILLNPSFLPHVTLRGRIPDHLLDQYEILSHDLMVDRLKESAPAEFILVEDGDDVVNHAAQRPLYQRSRLVEIPGGDHRFQSLNTINEAIWILSNSPWY